MNWLSHTPSKLIPALAQIKSENPELLKNVRFHFYCHVIPFYIEMMKKYGVDNHFVFHKPVPHTEIIKVIKAADGLLMIQGTRVDKPSFIYSSKIFEYLASENPILALVPEGDCRDLLRNYSNAYISNNPLSADSVKEATRSLLTDLQQRKTKHVRYDQIDQYEFRNITKSLAALFDQVVESK